MQRYLVEVAYKGTAFGGFQIQQNTNTIQAEVEKAFQIFYKQAFEFTGSSRTDAGVHALQNFFHFDTDVDIQTQTYHLNAILPADIVITTISKVASDFHCRFNATSREYEYKIYTQKNPFLQDEAHYFPYKLNLTLMQEAAQVLFNHQDYTSFSKKNTQVFTNLCTILKSEWEENQNHISYTVSANRFLRGMVRGLVATMLKVGTGKMSVAQFNSIIEARDYAKADFSAPAKGLWLKKVNY